MKQSDMKNEIESVMPKTTSSHGIKVRARFLNTLHLTRNWQVLWTTSSRGVEVSAHLLNFLHWTRNL